MCLIQYIVNILVCGAFKTHIRFIRFVIARRMTWCQLSLQILLLINYMFDFSYFLHDNGLPVQDCVHYTYWTNLEKLAVHHKHRQKVTDFHINIFGKFRVFSSLAHFVCADGKKLSHTQKIFAKMSQSSLSSLPEWHFCCLHDRALFYNLERTWSNCLFSVNVWLPYYILYSLQSLV